MNIEYSASPYYKDIEFLTEKINVETQEYGSAHPFSFFIRDTHKQIIAGCNGFVLYGVIYTDQLWVSSDCRCQGLGRKLMAEVETLGRKERCYLATVSTMTFQGVQGFYERIGYGVEYNRSDGEGITKFIFMSKVI
jgi:ribosomal protein S18 acetylase RimI-like enzyme